MQDNAHAMKFTAPQISGLGASLKASTAVGIIAAATLCHEHVAAATIVVDENNVKYEDTANSSYFFYYDINRSQDTAVQGIFLESGGGGTGGGSNIISTYNDGDNTPGTPGDNLYTSVDESLTLAQTGSIYYDGDYDGVAEQYVAFYLDDNQSGKDDGTPGNNYYDVCKLEIYTSANSQVTSYDNMDGSSVKDGNLAYSFDKDTDNGGDTIRLFYGTGQSNWDVVLYVPLDQFVLIDNDPNVADEEETYIQFYVEYYDTASSDVWGYDRGAPIIPEPSSALLVSLGGLAGLLRRRRA